MMLIELFLFKHQCLPYQTKVIAICTSKIYNKILTVYSYIPISGNCKVLITIISLSIPKNEMSFFYTIIIKSSRTPHFLTPFIIDEKTYKNQFCLISGSKRANNFPFYRNAVESRRNVPLSLFVHSLFPTHGIVNCHLCFSRRF